MTERERTKWEDLHWTAKLFATAMACAISGAVFLLAAFLFRIGVLLFRM